MRNTNTKVSKVAKISEFTKTSKLAEIPKVARVSKRARTARKARSPAKARRQALSSVLAKLIEVVLGGGAIKGFAHLGLLKALVELNVKIGMITGVSVGALIAAFFTNGYSPDQIHRILLKLLIDLDPESLKATFRMAGTRRLLQRHGMIDALSLFRKIVKEYKLKPQKNLRILAYNVHTGQAVIFEGTDYDLAVALAASCAIPGFMRPVWHGQQGLFPRLFPKLSAQAHHHGAESSHGILVDGSLHHPNPGHFSSGYAIISKLGFASQLPSDRLPLLDFGFHLLEMLGSPVLDWLFPDPKNHLVIRTGRPTVACMSFGISPKSCEEMINYAYEQSYPLIAAAIKAGKIPVAKRSNRKIIRINSKTAA